MAYRNGTYIAFDGLGETDPSKSDQEYYRTIEMWKANDDIEFSYANSHDKTFAVYDDSLRATLKARIQERLRNSKNILIILSSRTRKTGSMLSYEISQAADTYSLPLLVVYTDYRIVATPQTLSSYWPDTLATRINNMTATVLHLPFVRPAIFDAITDFSVNDLKNLSGGYNYYTEVYHRMWGCFKYAGEPFSNTKK